MTASEPASYAPNWDDGQLLTWSGKWHIAHSSAYISTPLAGEQRTLCGKYGYTRDSVPKSVRRLQEIKQGTKEAPLCKQCAVIYCARPMP